MPYKIDSSQEKFYAGMTKQNIKKEHQADMQSRNHGICCVLNKKSDKTNKMKIIHYVIHIKHSSQVTEIGAERNMMKDSLKKYSKYDLYILKNIRQQVDDVNLQINIRATVTDMIIANISLSIYM